MRKEFSTYDVDGDGTITIKELDTALKSRGKSKSQAELQAMIAEYDTDGNGTIDFDEFVKMISKI